MRIDVSCRAKSVPRLVLPLLAFVNALSAFAFALYLPALPRVADDFGVRAELAQQPIAVVLGANAVGIIIFGPLSDRVGRRPVLLGGLTVFVLASLACALASTINSLILLRFAQACAVIAGRVAVAEWTTAKTWSVTGSRRNFRSFFRRQRAPTSSSALK